MGPSTTPNTEAVSNKLNSIAAKENSTVVKMESL